jgi:hypothetical protein
MIKWTFYDTIHRNNIKIDLIENGGINFASLNSLI